MKLSINALLLLQRNSILIDLIREKIKIVLLIKLAKRKLIKKKVNIIVNNNNKRNNNSRKNKLFKRKSLKKTTKSI